MEIVSHLQVILGKSAESKSTVYLWVGYFKSRRHNLEDDPRTGRPSTVVNDENVEAVEELVVQDKQITVHEIAGTLVIGLHLVHEILHDCLGVSKVSARWVPRLLGPDQKVHQAQMW